MKLYPVRAWLAWRQHWNANCWQIVNPDTLEGNKAPYFIVLGQVTGIYIDDEMITPEGRFDTMKADPILRSGYHDYVCLDELFELVRPG